MKIAGGRTRGFTLIELVVVILILGILAATAAPRFVNLQGQARAASLNGARGAVASARTLAYALSAATNTGSATGITMDGSSVTMVGSYPTANNSGIGIAAGLTSDYSLTGGGTALGSVLSISVSGATTSTTCVFTYTAATSTAPATVGTVTSTGC